MGVGALGAETVSSAISDSGVECLLECDADAVRGLGGSFRRRFLRGAAGWEKRLLSGRTRREME